MKPRIGIVLGDPSGIGPELIARVFADRSLRQQAHGTACDIAGKGVTNPEATRRAFQFACDMAQARRGSPSA